MKTLPVKVLLYGESGTGKSTAAAHLADHRPIIYLDLEGTSKLLIETLSEEALDNLNYVQVPDHPKMPIGIQILYNFFSGTQPLHVCEEHGRVNCGTCHKAKASFQDIDYREISEETIVVLDSGTQLTKSSFYNATEGIDLQKTGKKGEQELDMTAYRRMEFLLDVILGGMKNAHFGVVVISHVHTATMPGGDIKFLPIIGSRNYSGKAVTYFDDVVYLQTVNRTRKIFNVQGSVMGAFTSTRSSIDLSKFPHPPTHFDIYPLFDKEYGEEKLNDVVEEVHEQASAKSKSLNLSL